MNVESLLRELRVDWESTLSEDFDPIPLIKSLEDEHSTEASNFRNIYHKVEQVMERIIENNFKAFNDSILLFSKVHRINKENLENIDEQVRFCNDMLDADLNTDIDTTEIKRNMWLRGICEALKEQRALADGIDASLHNRNYVYASVLAKKVFDAYTKYKLSYIKSLETLFHRVCEKRVTIIACLCAEIERFVRNNNELEYIDNLNAIVSLDGLKALDNHLHTRISDVIQDMYKRIVGEYDKLHGEDQLNTTVQNILHTTNKIFVKLLNVASKGLDNSTEVIDSKFFETEIQSKFKIFNRSYESTVKEIVLKSLKNIVHLFSFPNTTLKRESNFDIDDISDFVNYTDIFDKRFPVAMRFSENVEKLTALHVHLAPPFGPTVDALFDFLENIQYLDESVLKTEFYAFLRTQIDERYFKQRNNRVERKLIFLLKEDSSSYCVDHDGYLEFFHKINFGYIFYKKECNELGFFDFVFEMIGRKLKVLFFKIFDKKATRDTLFTGSSEVMARAGILERLKEHAVSSVSDTPSTFNRSKYIQITAVIRTIEALQGVYKEKVFPMHCAVSTSPSCSVQDNVNASACAQDKVSRKDTVPESAIMNLYSNLIKTYEEACRIDIVDEVMHSFGLFYRNTRHFFVCAKKISSIINTLRECTSTRNSFCYVFEIMNFYIQNNVENLSVFTRPELEAFLGNLELLDEILCEVKGSANDNLCESTDFFRRVMNGNVHTKKEKAFSERIANS